MTVQPWLLDHGNNATWVKSSKVRRDITGSPVTQGRAGRTCAVAGATVGLPGDLERSCSSPSQSTGANCSSLSVAGLSVAFLRALQLCSHVGNIARQWSL